MDVQVLLFEVGKGPAVVTVEHRLEEFQRLVGGEIESLRLFGDDDVFVICNEEGKLNSLPANRNIGFDILVGDFFITAGDAGGDFVALSPEQTSRVLSFMDGRGV